jgi:excisionase family DNA binding protein
MKADVRLTKAFYSPGEVAEMLGLHPDTILNYIHGGRIFAIQLSARTYRIPQREVRRLIAPETLKPPRIVQRGTGDAFAEFQRRIRDEVEEADRRKRGRSASRS